MCNQIPFLLAAFLLFEIVITTQRLNVTSTTVVVDLLYTRQQGYLGVCLALVLACS